MSLENFDEVALITRGFSSGTFFDNIENSSPNEINDSKLCGEYKRSNTTQYDVLFYTTNALPNVTNLINGTEKFYIDILSDAPVGTQILLQLESSNRATTTNYPVGRNSRFVVNTTKQNEWERLNFHFLDRPDLSTSNTSVNNLVLLFAPNSFTGHTYRFDNFDIYDRSILSNLSSLEIDDIKIFPNPLNIDFLKIHSEINLLYYQIFDLSGRTIKKGNLNNRQGVYEVEISHLSKGSYFVKVSNEFGEGKVLKFVKS